MYFNWQYAKCCIYVGAQIGQIGPQQTQYAKYSVVLMVGSHILRYLTLASDETGTA